MSCRLILFDAMALIYRSFYAIRQLNAPDGFPTNALFGFIKTIDQIKRKWSPDEYLVASDGGLPQERIRLIPSYKANRPPMPDDLRKQLPAIEEYLNLAGIHYLRQDGREADDIIASFALSASSRGAEVIIVSSDKDLFQLISDNVSMLLPTDTERLFDSKSVVEKTGVSPSQVVDLLALTGDSSDNIPGVDGVGIKTAASLLKEYGTIEGIFANIINIKSMRIRDKLSASRELLDRNRSAIRLLSYSDCAYEDGKFRARRADTANLVRFFDRYGMHAFAKNVAEPELF